MKVEQVFNILKKMDMNGRCIEGRIGGCELIVRQNNYSIVGITITPKKWHNYETSKNNQRDRMGDNGNNPLHMRSNRVAPTRVRS